VGTRNFRGYDNSILRVLKTEDVFSFKFLIHDIKADLKRLFTSKIKGEYYESDKVVISTGDKIFAEIVKEKVIKDIGFELVFQLVMEYGYYEGINLDYHIEYRVDGYSYNNSNEALDVMQQLLNSYTKYNEGMIQMKMEGIDAWIDNFITKLDKKINNVYKEYTIGYASVGAFSNGSGICELIKEE